MADAAGLHLYPDVGAGLAQADLADAAAGVPVLLPPGARRVLPVALTTRMTFTGTEAAGGCGAAWCVRDRDSHPPGPARRAGAATRG